MSRDIRFLLKSHYSNSRALVIGIDKYTNASPLSYAVSDASAIRDILIKELAFPEENVIYLADQDATKRNIEHSFYRFTKSDIELDDRILVFYAGHSCTWSGFRGEVGLLVPHDGDRDDHSTLIAWDALTKTTEYIRAKHILFIMDTCYGGLAFTRSVQSGSTRFLDDMMLRFSRQVLTAGKADEEVADSGGPLPEHSVFTGHLIEGLRGNAAVAPGVLTANGLMAYVHAKVAQDPNSNQTPHYGYFDGDGDFILRGHELTDIDGGSDSKGNDRLFVVPFTEDLVDSGTGIAKVRKAKSLLANDSSAIELHDFFIAETKRFLSATGEDAFNVQQSFSQEELIARVSRYEESTRDLAMMTACLAYWARPIHKSLLQKVMARLADRSDSRNGVTGWLALRWYPTVMTLYYAGVAAVDAKRYDSLANVFYTESGPHEYRQQSRSFIEVVGDEIGSINEYKVFNRLKEHERHYVAMSEYLYKMVQPDLDDVLFVGTGYERSFDEFEMLLGLVVIDIRLHRGLHNFWPPLGRFAWKHRNRDENSPLLNFINQAKSDRENWEPLKAGLFGGDFERFISAADGLTDMISRLGWL